MKKNTIRVFEALSHRSRLRLVQLLGTREREVHELSKRLKIVESAVHHHLHVLRDAGLLHTEKHGRKGAYSLDKQALREALADLAPYVDD